MSRRNVRRALLALTAFVIVAIVAVGILAISFARKPFPQATGELAIDGLTSSVTVSRDDRGIPTIYADNSSDLFRAQGFVSAQDRFFEMDLRRHITAGRLAELVGEDGVEADRVIRTMGWRRVAEQELPTLAPATRQYLQAYADGVNAYIRSRDSQPDAMGLEYRLLATKNPGYRVEPWTPVDSLAWLKAMAWDLRGDYDDELARARLSRTIPLKQLAALYPAYPFDRNQPILSAKAWAPSTTTAAAASVVPSAFVGPTASPAPSATAKGTDAAHLPTAGGTPSTAAGSAKTMVPDSYAAMGLTDQDVTGSADAIDRASAALGKVPQTFGRGEGIGSNSWVVSGSRTTTGKPLLANDPHLSLGIPSIWTQVSLQCRTVSAECPFQVSGFSFSGLPGVVIGHNAKISWGFTNLGPDVTDFFLEKVEGETYLRDGMQVPLETRTETIKVAGGTTQTITVRSTEHGPIMSDVVESAKEAGDRVAVRGAAQSDTYAVSLAWTALQPGKTADAIFALNTAENFDQFRSAAAKFAVPAQNLIYADVEGHIGYQAPGVIPIRRAATPGSVPGFWPAPGWDSQWDWTGTVPHEQMPYAYDPPEGFIVTANQAVTKSSTPFLTTEWDYGFRAERIRTLLAAKPKVSLADMQAVQGDNRNVYAPSLVEHLLSTQVDEFTAQAQRLLTGWDGDQPADKSRDSSSAAYYNAVWKRLLAGTFEELPPDLAANGGSRWMVVMENLLKDPKNDWWDDKRTPGVTEGAGEILRQAQVDARLDLARQLGKVPATWRWGRLHQLDLKHQVMGGEGVPSFVHTIFNREGIEVPGGSSIVNAFGWDAAEPGYRVTAGPSMRMVIDLSNFDNSVWVNSTGQSGHAFHDNYDDQIAAWVDNEAFPWPWTQAKVDEAAAATLTLKPPTPAASPPGDTSTP